MRPHALGLVDALIEPMTHERAEALAPARSLVIPEWRSAYRGGVVDVRHLRRHLLATGESGSGKTLSAVLPLFAAAYRSPEVGVALVIDPKRDLGAELERLRASDAAPSEAKKRIVWIRPEALAIDLMSSDAWSIDGLIKDRRYWSARSGCSGASRIWAHRIRRSSCSASRRRTVTRTGTVRGCASPPPSSPWASSGRWTGRPSLR